jgi:hypothetical protein
MWVAAKIPIGFVLLVIFLAVVGARKILSDITPEESNYRTELTLFGKITLGFLFGISILFALALLLLFVVVVLRA